MRPSKISAISAELDYWMRRATDASIDAARNVLGAQGPIRPGTQVGMFTKSEWGWLCSSAVWGWIATRAEQAATEGWNAEHAIRDTGLTPDPWLAGAIHAALPKLFEACPDLDCAKPVGEWSRDEITELLLAAFNLIQRAIEARDATETKVAGKPTSADIVARQTNGSVGNPRMTADEFNNLPPFA
jgi:hypothetical protein